jgi:carotenoid cleavage dioxygenase-like enzyme
MAGEPAFGWEPRHGSRIGVLPRHAEGGAMRWFEVETASIIHAAAAFEDGTSIVLDAPRFRTQTVFGEEAGDASASEELAHMHRWRLDLGSGRVEEEDDADGPTVEFPRIDERRLGRAHRFIYAGRQCEGGSSVRFDGLVKFDRERGGRSEFAYGPGVFGGEAVFAPRPGGTEEDDGWLVTFVHDEATDRSRCLVFDARQPEAGPLAAVAIPWRVPYGFHAGWVPAS